jgi:Short C-terminal domain
MAGATFGSELTSWDYRNIVGVQIHTGMMSGAVIIQAPGQSGKSTNTWKNKDSDPYKAPNAIPINRPWQPTQAGVARLRQLIERAHNGGAAGVPAPATSLVAEVERLAQLRASGALTEAEFESLKAKLLAG